jgi:fatty-acid desaturase
MIELSFQKKLIIMLTFHFLLMVYAIALHWNLWLFIISFLFLKIISNLGNEIGLHRLWTHKSFKTSKIKEYLLHICSVPLLAGSSIVYAGVHRQHHAFSDTDQDPHDTSSLLKLFFYIRKNKDYSINPKIVSDLIKDPLHKWLHKNYFRINLLLLIGCLIIIGPIYTGYFLSFIVIYNFLIIGLTNYLGHKPDWGVRNFDTNDKSSNNHFLQILTLNHHGLHHNHHKNPGSYSNAILSHEKDPIAWIIEKFFITNKF